MASINPIKPPREHFRFMFKEQLRTRIYALESSDLTDIGSQAIEAGAMDAFDYVWRIYGLDQLDIRIGRE